MPERFVDQKKLLEKEVKLNPDFIDRIHGVPNYYYLLAFIFGLASWFVIGVYDHGGNFPASYISSGIILIILGVVTLFFVKKTHREVASIELQNALFAGATKLVTDFFVVLRYDGTVVYVDPEFRKRFLHKVRQGMLGIDALSQIGGLSEMQRERLLLALSEGRSDTVEFELPSMKDQQRHIALTVEPIDFYPKDYETKQYTLSVNPLTRPTGYFLLKAEQSADHDDHDYLNQLNVGFYSAKPTGELIVVNDHFAQLLGHSNQELVHQKVSIRDLIVEGLDTDIFQNGGIWRGEVTCKHQSGEMVQLLMVHMTTENEQGKIIAHRGIIIEAPEYEHPASPAVQFSEHESNFLLHSPIASFYVDKRGNIVEYNQSFKEMLDAHMKFDEQSKASIFKAFDKDSRNEIKEFINKAILKPGQSLPAIDVAFRGGEEGVTASLYLNAVPNEKGEVLGLVGQLVDSTELKNLELRFVHSQKMQAVGQLAGGIAHDFNNLLTAMMGFCDLLLMRHPAGDQSFADIMQIKQNANRAANLVRQLLAFSRKQTLQPEIINITDVFADLSNLIGRLIGENIELVMNYGETLWKVKADQGQLEQVIINLAVNARDAINGAGLLTITTSNVTLKDRRSIGKKLIAPAEDEAIELGDYVKVEVTDSGSGMSRELMGQIFEPFFSTKELGSGTGLGLSTVYGIIKQTGGYIYVSSKEGKGTTFTIFLPAYKNVDELKEKKDHAPAEVSTADLTGKGTVLLVEDEAPVRLFSVSALKKKGYTVYEAESGEHGLDVVKEHGDKLDIIISDVVMPGMNGTTMVQKVQETYPDVKVIFMSGYAEDAFKDTFWDDKKFNFLAKPYTLKQLATKVKEVIEGEEVS